MVVGTRAKNVVAKNVVASVEYRITLKLLFLCFDCGRLDESAAPLPGFGPKARHVPAVLRPRKSLGTWVAVVGI